MLLCGCIPPDQNIPASIRQHHVEDDEQKNRQTNRELFSVSVASVSVPLLQERRRQETKTSGLMNPAMFFQ